MIKELHVTLYWNYTDFLCGKVRYGVRIGGMLLGFSLKISRDVLEQRKAKQIEWLRTCGNYD